LQTASAGGATRTGQAFIHRSIAIVVFAVADLLGGVVRDLIEGCIKLRLVVGVVGKACLAICRNRIQHGCVELDTDDVGFDAVVIPNGEGFCGRISGIARGIAICDQNDVIGSIPRCRRLGLFEAVEIDASLVHRCSHTGIAFIGGITIDRRRDGCACTRRNRRTEDVIRSKGRKTKIDLGIKIRGKGFDGVTNNRVPCGGCAVVHTSRYIEHQKNIGRFAGFSNTGVKRRPYT
jgi:hypothetical protein